MTKVKIVIFSSFFHFDVLIFRDVIRSVIADHCCFSRQAVSTFLTSIKYCQEHKQTLVN